MRICLRSKRSEVRILSGVPLLNQLARFFPQKSPSDRLPGHFSVLVLSTFRSAVQGVNL